MACALLVGCERTLKDMYEQPRLGPEAASPLFTDGKGSRPPVPGTEAAAMGDLAFTSAGTHGRAELAARRAAEDASAPTALTRTLLLRGQERYDIACSPCHSPLGDGDGMVARRGFPHPPTLHQARLRDTPDRHLFDVMTQGYGVMPSLADRVTPQDRWAIVAYVRALQLSQDAPVATLPPGLQATLAFMRPVASSVPPEATDRRAPETAQAPRAPPPTAPTLGAANPETD
jgi:mono/diheme cytochrome c family protein